jgi:hypothetical protein
LIPPLICQPLPLLVLFVVVSPCVLVSVGRRRRRIPGRFRGLIDPQKK